MFRPMRRKTQQLSEEACLNVLEKNTNGVLSLMGDGGYPYGVPLSYTFADGTIYFHCAKAGHKLDALKNCSKVCFTVVDKDEVIPEKFTTYYRSVIVFGRAEIVEDKEQKLSAIRNLCQKYAPNETKENREKEIASTYNAMCIVGITPEHMTGKEAIELVKKPQA